MSERKNPSRKHLREIIDNDSDTNERKTYSDLKKQTNKPNLASNSAQSSSEYMDLSTSEKYCEIKESKNRQLYLDFIAKFQIPMEEFEKENEISRFTEKIYSKNKDTYSFSLSNIIHQGTQSSTLVFLFQNKPGLNEEEFKEEVFLFENKFKEELKEIKNEGNKEQEKEMENPQAQGINSDNKFNNKEQENNKMDIDNEISNDNNNENNILMDLDPKSTDKTKIKENKESQKPLKGKYYKLREDKQLEIYTITDKLKEIENKEKQESQENEELENNNFNNNNNESQNQNQTDQINNNSNKENKIQREKEKEILEKILKQKEKELENLEFESEETYQISITLTLLDTHITSKVFYKVLPTEILELPLSVPTAFYNNNNSNQINFQTLKNPVNIILELQVKKIYKKTKNKYTGIINEAMTCYMNSLIQNLFHLSYFRRAVFQIPYDKDNEQSNPNNNNNNSNNNNNNRNQLIQNQGQPQNPNNPNSTDSVVNSFQRLFYDLMTQEKPISTNRLVRSFGWSREELFIQHDVQEFNLLLSDLMELKMKGTKSEGTFKFLFEGTCENYIECIDIDYKSIKTEKFSDIQLTVKGCKNIFESLEKFTENEILDGGNKYEAEGHGKQRAKKGIRFLEFPKVLNFQLKRFEYDNYGNMDKVNANFEYPNELDLNKFVKKSDNSDGKLDFVNYEYELYSVVVHRGSIDRGHYYAFIKPDFEENIFYQFNDEVVKKADDFEVFLNNYGGDLEIFKHKQKGVISTVNSRSDANAYLLVYLRKDYINTIMKKTTVEDIPNSLMQKINEEKEYENKIEILRIRKFKSINIYLFSKEILLSESNNNLSLLPSILDLNKDESLLENEKLWLKLNLPKDTKIGELRKYISKKTKIPEEYILLYTYAIPDNKNTLRNIVKRYEFKMHLIEESSMFEKNISGISNYNDSRNVMKHTFLFVDFAFKSCKNPINNNPKIDFNVFEKNIKFNANEELLYENYNNNFLKKEDEYPIDENPQRVIYSEENSYWKFKENINEVNFQEIGFNFQVTEGHKCYDFFKLFIVKKYDEEFQGIKISDVFSFPVFKENSDKEIIENLIYSMGNSNDFSFLLENIEAIKSSSNQINTQAKDSKFSLYLEKSNIDGTNLQKISTLFLRNENLLLKMLNDNNPDNNNNTSSQKSITNITNILNISDEEKKQQEKDQYNSKKIIDENNINNLNNLNNLIDSERTESDDSSYNPSMNNNTGNNSMKSNEEEEEESESESENSQSNISGSFNLMRSSGSEMDQETMNNETASFLNEENLEEKSNNDINKLQKELRNKEDNKKYDLNEYLNDNDNSNSNNDYSNTISSEVNSNDLRLYQKKRIPRKSVSRTLKKDNSKSDFNNNDNNNNNRKDSNIMNIDKENNDKNDNNENKNQIMENDNEFKRSVLQSLQIIADLNREKLQYFEYFNNVNNNNNNINNFEQENPKNFKNQSGSNFLNFFQIIESDCIILYPIIQTIEGKNQEENQLIFPNDKTNSNNSNTKIAKKNFNKILDDLLYAIYIYIDLIFDQNSRFLFSFDKSKKLKMRMDLSQEDILNKIHKYILYNLEHFELKNIFDNEITTNIKFLISSAEGKKVLNLEEFISKLSPIYYELEPHQAIRDNQHTQSYIHFLTNLFQNYPLIEFLDLREGIYKLTISINYLENNFKRDLIPRDFQINDINSNPFMKLYLTVPKNLSRCSDYIEYLKEILLENHKELLDVNIPNINPLINNNNSSNNSSNNLSLVNNNTISNSRKNSSTSGTKSKLNSRNNLLFINEFNLEEKEKEIKEIKEIMEKSEEDLIFSLNNFKFLLQNEKRLFAYDLFVKKEEELFKYDSYGLDINYRLQPYPTQELKYFNDFEKIFVAFCKRDMSSICEPMVICLTNETTIKKMKLFIYEKLIKTNKFKNLNFSEIKFYVYKLVNYKVQKEYLLINDQDEKKIVNYFKNGGVRNVLVELLDFENENSKGITIG